MADKKKTKKKAVKNLTKIGGSKGITAGRPKGAKNKTTIFKEVMKVGFEDILLVEGMKVVQVVIDRAKEGDMSAAKMLLDRILPVTKAVDINANDIAKSGGVTIHIEQLVAETGRKTELIEDGEIVDESR